MDWYYQVEIGWSLLRIEDRNFYYLKMKKNIRIFVSFGKFVSWKSFVKSSLLFDDSIV